MGDSIRFIWCCNLFAYVMDHITNTIYIIYLVVLFQWVRQIISQKSISIITEF